jgi:hypothetical protein
MAQQKRVALTMPPHLDRVFDRLAELEGKPKTKVIIDYLESLTPHAESMIAALESIKEKRGNPVEALQALTAEMLKTIGQLGQEMDETMKVAKAKEAKND